MRQFAMGVIYARPSGANPTPIPIAILKDANVTFKVTKKPLRGQYKGVIDVGEGPLDIDLKIKNADFRGSVIGMVIAGITTVGGSRIPVTGEAATVPTTPFQVTVANGGTMAEDGGVLDLTAGKWLARVAAGPTTGQYTVNEATGLYTFAAADVAHNLSIVYAYTAASVGSTSTLLNSVMGPSTGYAVRVYNNFTVAGVIRPEGFDFPNAHFTNLGFGFKAEDWAEQDLQAIIAQDTASLTMFKAYLGE